MGQKVLVIGSGAREHTIAYTLLKAPSIDEVTVAPGNPGMLKGRHPHHAAEPVESRRTYRIREEQWL